MRPLLFNKVGNVISKAAVLNTDLQVDSGGLQVYLEIQSALLSISVECYQYLCLVRRHVRNCLVFIETFRAFEG